MALEQLAERIRPTELARDAHLPLLGSLKALIPDGGLGRGTSVAVSAQHGIKGATSLALAVAAGAAQNGSWIAAMGLDSLGLVAASGLGVPLDRLVLVPGPRRLHRMAPDVAAALIDGFDVVLMDPRGLRPGDARRLVGRVRERRSVLVAVGADLPGHASPLRLTVTGGTWQGLGQGWGHLQGRRVTADGRRPGDRGPASARRVLAAIADRDPGTRGVHQ